MPAVIRQRNRQIVRHWQILRALEARPATLQQLAFAFDVSARTIRRDLEALEEVHFPIYTDQTDDGAVRWHLLTTGVAPVRRAS